MIDSPSDSLYLSKIYDENTLQKKSSQLSTKNIDDIMHISPKRSTSRDIMIHSRLSFIVKEKLHEYAKDLKRRTSQVLFLNKFNKILLDER